MQVDPRSMPPLAVYKLLIGCIVPRPIAWVSTVSADGIHNLAPFSLFMECRVAQILRVGHGPHSLVLGEILNFHLRDDLYDCATGRVDVHRLKPVGRLAGQLYTHVHEIFAMQRPDPNYAG